MSKDNLEDLVQLLNFKLGKGKSGHECLVKFLRDIGLVEFQTRFSTDKHNYSLFSREEVEAWVKTMGDNAPTEIRQLTFALNKEKNLTSEGDFSTTIFPEDSSSNFALFGNISYYFLRFF